MQKQIQTTKGDQKTREHATLRSRTKEEWDDDPDRRHGRSKGRRHRRDRHLQPEPDGTTYFVPTGASYGRQSYVNRKHSSDPSSDVEDPHAYDNPQRTFYERPIDNVASFTVRPPDPILISRTGGHGSLVGDDLFERFADIGDSLSLAVTYASAGLKWCKKAGTTRSGTHKGAADWLKGMSKILAKARVTSTNGSKQYQELQGLSQECLEASRCTAERNGLLDAEEVEDVEKRFTSLEGELDSMVKRHAESIAWGILSDAAFREAFLSKSDIWWDRWDYTIVDLADTAYNDPEAVTIISETANIDMQSLEKRFNRKG